MTTHGLSIAFFGSSLAPAWNSSTASCRDLLRALAGRGHSLTVYEPDGYARQERQSLVDEPWARSIIYSPELCVAQRAIRDARQADVIIKASGTGVLDDYLEAAVADLKDRSRLVVFWDVDAPATLDHLLTRPLEPLLQVIPSFDLVLAFGGGAPAVDAYTALGARNCHPIDHAFDPDAHCPAPPDSRFDGDLLFSSDRDQAHEDLVDEFFFAPAAALPHLRFVLCGSGWHERVMPDNVRYVGHVHARDLNVANSTPRAVLNLNTESTARFGYTPPGGLFEAAGAGACVISGGWQGIGQVLSPGREVLPAADRDDVVSLLKSVTMPRAREIGRAARRRLLGAHTYEHRAAEIETALLAAQPYPTYGAIPIATLPAIGAEPAPSSRPYFIY